MLPWVHIYQPISNFLLKLINIDSLRKYKGNQMKNWLIFEPLISLSKIILFV